MNKSVNPPFESQLTRTDLSVNASLATPNVANPQQSRNDRRQFGIIKILIASGQAYQLSRSGTFIYLDAAEFTTGGYAVTNQIRALTSNENEVWLNRAQSGYYFETAFNHVTFFNESNENVELSLYIGFGRIQKDAQDSYGYAPLGAATGSLTRPANVTPYAADQIVADDTGVTTPLFTGPLSFEKLFINSVSIVKSSTTTADTAFSLEFWSADPGALADQSPAPFLFANRDNFMGVIEIDEFVTGGAGSDASYYNITGLNIPLFTTGFQFFFVRLIARGAYVPASGEQFFFNVGYTQAS